MSYIDGFVASVPSDRREDYADYCRRVDALMIEHGATRVVDGWGDDVPHGKMTDLYRAVAATEGETIVFGWVEWPDKATRTAGWAALEKDERMSAPMLLDGKRMIFGGFETLCITEK